MSKPKKSRTRTAEKPTTTQVDAESTRKDRARLAMLGLARGRVSLAVGELGMAIGILEEHGGPAIIEIARAADARLAELDDAVRTVLAAARSGMPSDWRVVAAWAKAK